MEIYVYDETLTLKGVIDEFTSLMWTRRYWSAGEFKLLVPLNQNNVKLLVKRNLIRINTDDEAGQITYINISKDDEGKEEIEVQGKLITSWLDKRIVLDKIVCTDNSQNIINRIVNENLINPSNIKRVIPLLNLENEAADLECSDTTYSSQKETGCLTEVETIAKAAGIGFKICADVKNKCYTFVVYKGNDYTTEQDLEKPCIFAQEFDNIYKQEFENSIEDLKTACYVGGEILEDTPQEIIEIGDASGLDRDEVYIGATDISRTVQDGETETTLTIEEYHQMLYDRGYTELEQYAETLNFASKVNAYGNLKYKFDYDVGDRVTCLQKTWGVKIHVRITEIIETYQDNKTDIDITFGESLPTLFDKINKLR